MKTRLAATLLMFVSSTALARQSDAPQPTVPVQQKDTYQIKGRVVDAKGKPIPNIQIATGWNFHAGPATPRWRSDIIAKTGTSLRTDEQGRFSGTLYARRPTVALYAFDQEHKLGGIGIFSMEEPDKECVIKVAPLTRLHGEIGVGELDVKDSTFYIYVTDKRARIAIASMVSKSTDFSFLMPPGEYEMSFSAKDVDKVTMEVALTKDDLDLQMVDLSPTNLAQHYGKEPPPWNITDARGVSKDIKLADYKGKWVLIEFWAYW